MFFNLRTYFRQMMRRVQDIFRLKAIKRFAVGRFKLMEVWHLQRVI